MLVSEMCILGKNLVSKCKRFCMVNDCFLAGGQQGRDQEKQTCDYIALWREQTKDTGQ